MTHGEEQTMLAPEDWELLQDLVDEAADLQGEMLVRFLDNRCPNKPYLKAQAQRLLGFDPDKLSLLDNPVFSLEKPEEPTSEPEMVGEYQLIRILGQGGMGTVYLAHRPDSEVHKDVALKILKKGMDSEGLIRRFHTERKILASLDHPHIAGLIEGGSTQDGRPYFVMEYVEGEPLMDWCDNRKLGINDRVKLFRQVCSAVSYAHRNLVIHRDLKPSNILVTADGRPKLLDFGIARLMEEGDDTHHLTAAGERALTPDYASPEQLNGNVITTASDIFSLGLLLYELLTGRNPFRQKRLTGEQTGNRTDRLEKPSSAVLRPLKKKTGDTISVITADEVSAGRALEPGVLKRKLSGDLDTIILHACHPAPEQRYASVELFEEDLARFQSGFPILARSESPWYTLRKLIARNRAAFTVLTTAILITLLATGLSIKQYIDTNNANRRQELFSQMMFRMITQADGMVARNGMISIKDFLSNTLEGIDEFFEGEEDLKAAFMNTLGSRLNRVGDYRTSEPVLQRALKSWLAQSEGNDKIHADILLNLADAQRGLEEYRACAANYQKARAIYTEIDDQVGFARALAGEGTMLYLSGAFDQQRRGALDGIEYLEGARSILQAHRGEFFETYIQTSISLGEAHGHATQFRTGLDVLQEAAAEMEQAGLTRHALYGDYLEASAFLHDSLNDKETAEAHYLASLRLKDSLMGEEHPSLAVNLHNVALFYAKYREYKKAIPLFQRALGVLRHQHQRDTKTALIFNSNFAYTLAYADLAKEAIPLLEEVFRDLEVEMVGQQRRRAVAARVLALSYDSMGQYEDAVDWYRRTGQFALEDNRMVMFNFTKLLIVNVYNKIGNWDQVTLLLDDIVMDISNPQYSAIQALRGNLHLVRGETEKAEVYYAEAAKRAPEHRLTFLRAPALIEVNPEEAVRLLEAAVPPSEESSMPRIEINETKLLLVRAYRAAGRTEDAEALNAAIEEERAELRAIFQQGQARAKTSRSDQSQPEEGTD